MNTEKEIREYVEDFMGRMFFAYDGKFSFVQEDAPADDSYPSFYATLIFSDGANRYEYEFQFCCTFPNNVEYHVGDEGETCALTEMNVWQYLYWYHAVPDPYGEKAVERIAMPFPANDHEREVLTEIEAMAAEPRSGFWSRALAQATLQILKRYSA